MTYQDLLREAYKWAARTSDDRSTQNGSVLVRRGQLVPLLLGVNRFPTRSLAENEANHERPRKYAFTEHAERDVIYSAAKCGLPTDGLVMVCPWACCADCARAICIAGIQKVIAHKQAHDISPERWKQSIEYGKEILAAHQVDYVLWDGKVGGVENLFDGEIWCP
jgi:dCMP deaminase